MPDPGLVFDGVKHVVDGDPEWNQVGLCSAILAQLAHVSGRFVDRSGIVIRGLPRGGTVA